MPPILARSGGERRTGQVERHRAQHGKAAFKHRGEALRVGAALDQDLVREQRSLADPGVAELLAWSGYDFVIIDLEGNPALPLSERRRKRSAISSPFTRMRPLVGFSRPAISFK